MEKNCLVTKLKATVNNNNLLKVGEMFIDIEEHASPTNQTNRLYLGTNNTSDLVLEVENGMANLTLDENMESGWTNKITLPKSSYPTPVFVRNGNYRIKILPKYSLTEIGRYTNIISQKIFSVDTKYLKYSPDLTTLMVKLSGDIANLSGCVKLYRLGWANYGTNLNLTGDIASLAPLTALGYISLGASNLTGDIASLAPLTALKQLGISSPNITGDIASLAPLTSLTELGLQSSPNVIGDIKNLKQPLTFIALFNTQVTGELIEFVKAQRAAGRTTGSCAGIWGDVITFNGIGNLGFTDKTLTWTESTIALDGVTVNQ